MRYYVKDGKEYVENGKALLQVKTLNIVPSPRTAKRVIRVMIVRKAVKQSWRNPIAENATLGLSFPYQDIDRKDYVWAQGEECQIDFHIEMNNCDKVEGDIDDGNGPPLIDFSKQ